MESKLETEKHRNLITEANIMIAHGNQSSHGPNNINELSDFSIDAIIAEFQSYAPSLYTFSSNFVTQVIMPVRFLSL